MSLTRLWAPKEMAKPRMPAPASKRADVHEDVETQEDRDPDDDNPAEAPQQLSDGVTALFPFGERRVVPVIYRLDDPSGDEADETPGAEGQKPDEGDLGQLADQLRRVQAEELGDLPEGLGESEERHGRNVGAATAAFNPRAAVSR